MTLLTPSELAHYVPLFWRHVAKSDESGCWTWTAARNSDGYGSFWVGKKPVSAHRFSWMITKDIPSGMLVCHHCDNPPCVNPAHLFVGTMWDNVKDMMSKGRANKAHGAANGRSKLSEKDVAKIRARRSSGEMLEAISHDFGISQAHVSKICSLRAWRK